MALVITRGTPISSTLMVVRMLTSTFSPMQTITTSQFWMPVSRMACSLSSSTTKA